MLSLKIRGNSFYITEFLMNKLSFSFYILNIDVTSYVSVLLLSSYVKNFRFVACIVCVCLQSCIHTVIYLKAEDL